MTYSLISRNGGEVNCITTGSRQALSYSSDIGAAYDMNVASAIVDTTGGADTITCSGGPALEIYSNAVDAVSEVDFLRLDQAVAGTTIATRQRAPRGEGDATRR